MASAHTTALTEAIQTLVDATLAADPGGKRAALAAVEHRVRDVPRRTGVPLSMTFQVFRRDSWTCRYCGGKTVALPVLRLLSSLYPIEFPHHQNWKAGQVTRLTCWSQPVSITVCRARVEAAGEIQTTS